MRMLRAGWAMCRRSAAVAEVEFFGEDGEVAQGAQVDAGGFHAVIIGDFGDNGRVFFRFWQGG